MSRYSRRHMVMGGIALPFLAACGNGIGSEGADRIDARSDAALAFLYSELPGARELGESASGVLIMPLVTEAGLGIGASYGQGALRVNGATVDYYAAFAGTIGLQIGAQQYAHALFFMTDEALREFRASSGWAAGADVRYAFNVEAGGMGVDTNTLSDPVIAIVFGQAGLIVGATLDGTRYTRIAP